MHGLHYRAIDKSGHVHTGFLRCKSTHEVEEWMSQCEWQQLPSSLKQKLLNLLRIRPRSATWSKTSAALFTLNFSQLLNAGVPILQALQEITALESNALVSRALDDVHSRVDQGELLSNAMSQHPDMFAADYIASVRAGERSGKLSQCLALQAKNLQWQSAVIDRLKTVLAYPLFALVSIVVVMLFVLLYLVPAMLPLLNMNTTNLPLRTQWLLELSSFIRVWGFQMLSAMCVLVILMLMIASTDSKFRRWMYQSIMRSRYGLIISNFSIARYAHTASLLYETGIELTDAMKISQEIVRNSLLREQLEDAHKLVMQGESFGNAMLAQSSLPSLFARMIVAGERAGVVGVALSQSADQMQCNAQYSLDRVERLIGPTLLCIMGFVLLWVATSVLSPIYSSISDVGAFL